MPMPIFPYQHRWSVFVVVCLLFLLSHLNQASSYQAAGSCDPRLPILYHARHVITDATSSRASRHAPLVSHASRLQEKDRGSPHLCDLSVLGGALLDVFYRAGGLVSSFPGLPSSSSSATCSSGRFNLIGVGSVLVVDVLAQQASPGVLRVARDISRRRCASQETSQLD